MSNYNYKALKNESCIFRHKVSKRYLVRKTVNGKEYQQTFDCKYDAIEFRNRIRTDIRKGIVPIGNSHTLEQIANEYLAKKKLKLKESTFIKKTEQLKALEPLFDLEMKVITNDLLYEFIDQEIGLYRSGEHINFREGENRRRSYKQNLGLLSSIFIWYLKRDKYKYESLYLSNPVDTELIEHSFFDVVKIRNTNLTINDAFMVMKYLKGSYRKLFWLQYRFALRISEALAIRVSDINFDRLELKLQKPFLMNSSRRIIGHSNKLKEGKEYRKIRLTNHDVLELKRIINERCLDSEYVTTNNKGEPISYKSALTNYNKAFEAAGLDFSGTHCLRHGAAKEIRRRLGLDGVIGLTGQSPQVADHYSKLTEDDHQESSYLMSEMLQHQVRVNTEDYANVLTFPSRKSN